MLISVKNLIVPTIVLGKTWSKTLNVSFFLKTREQIKIIEKKIKIVYNIYKKVSF